MDDESITQESIEKEWAKRLKRKRKNMAPTQTETEQHVGRVEQKLDVFLKDYQNDKLENTKTLARIESAINQTAAVHALKIKALEKKYDGLVAKTWAILTMAGGSLLTAILSFLQR